MQPGVFIINLNDVADGLLVFDLGLTEGVFKERSDVGLSNVPALVLNAILDGS